MRIPDRRRATSSLPLDAEAIMDIESYAASLAYSRDIPSARLGRAEEVAALVAFLASGRAYYATGASMNCDGGLARFISKEQEHEFTRSKTRAAPR